jgi:hypothetical protein
VAALPGDQAHTAGQVASTDDAGGVAIKSVCASGCGDIEGEEGLAIANLFYETTYCLDTPGTTLLKYIAGANPGTVLNIKGIRWVGATTAGHACIIQREDNLVYWESLASGANYIESDTIERQWQQNFKLTTLGSGRVYIYLYAGSFS